MARIAPRFEEMALEGERNASLQMLHLSKQYIDNTLIFEDQVPEQIEIMSNSLRGWGTVPVMGRCLLKGGMQSPLCGLGMRYFDRLIDIACKI